MRETARPSSLLTAPAPAAWRRQRVPRPRLVRRLVADPVTRLVLIVAPAGYGKTTLLDQWERRDVRSFARLALKPPDDDPARLAARMESALAGVPRRRPRVLVLDDAHHLGETALDVVGGALDGLEPGSVIALASRRVPALPVARLRSEGIVAELGAGDLAMTRVEAALLLAGADTDPDTVDRLFETTEGWPAGLALAQQASSALPRGDDRVIADYLQSEVLAGRTEPELAFLRRTSVLERLSGPLCDAVLQCRGSGARLRELARAGIPLEALDARDCEFRYHPLLAQMLRAELRRAEHPLEPGLHRRASGFYEREHEPEAAVEHAIMAGDAERAGQLIWELAPALAFGGRSALLGDWLDRLADRTIADDPRLAAAAATFHFARCDTDRAEHWRRAAGPTAAALNAGLTPGTVVTGTTGPFAVLGRLGDGVAAHLAGDRERAAARLREGAKLGTVDAPLLRAVCTAQLGLLAAEAGDWDEAALHAADTGEQVGDEPLLALVHVLAAVVEAESGSPDTARREAAEARRLLAAAPAPAPWLGAEVCVWLARAAIRLSDVAGARALLATASRHRRELPDGVVVERWIADTWARADAFAAGATGAAPTLTIAELRVLRFLPSHLSFREIGARLEVSTNTVKTQAMAIYRKLDVSSRSEAVLRGRAVGLLDG